MKALLTGAMLLLTMAAFAQEHSAPPALPALQHELGGLLFAARDNASLAITHEQAQKLVPLVQRWKTADLNLSAADAQTVWDGVQTVLTADQRAYKMAPRPAGQGGQRPGNSEQSTESPHDRQMKSLDRLLQRLSSL
jgi:hypothetical protein